MKKPAAPRQPDSNTAAIWDWLHRDPEVNRLLGGFRETTGVKLRVVPLCPPTVADLAEHAHEHGFCEQFMALSDESRKHCLQVHSALRTEAMHATGVVCKSCVAGLAHGAAPILVFKKPVGLLVFAGVVESSPPKTDSCQAVKRFLEKECHSTNPAPAIDALDGVMHQRGRQIEGLTAVVNAITDWLEERALHVPDGPHGALPATLFRALEFADAHFDDAKLANIRAVAKEMRVTTRWLGSLFRTHLGTTFTDWLARHRVSIAMARLRSSQDRILEIAFAAGFNSVSSFQRIFRKQTGITPGDYRRGVEPLSFLDKKPRSA